MLKEVHTVTPECIDNRGELGVAEVLKQRLFDYMVKSATESEGRAKFIVSIQSIPKERAKSFGGVHHCQKCGRMNTICKGGEDCNQVASKKNKGATR